MPVSDVTWRCRQAEVEAQRRIGPDRLVDMSVRIHVVRQDLEHGVEAIPGMAPVVSVAEHDVGGIWDTVLGRYVGFGAPKIWYASEAAIDAILHADTMPRGILVHGAMGSGKTRGVLAQWVIVRALAMAEYAPIEGGLTAPTDSRLEEAVSAMRSLMRPDWYSYHQHQHLFRLRNGVSIRGIGTARRSAAQGSRVQGWNWAFHGGDEIQDQADEHANIEARGRRAPRGRYMRLATSTAKDTSDWRALRAQLLGSGQWEERRMSGPANPFVPQEFWESLRLSISDREYRRIVLAENLGPERATYPSFSRDVNVRPIPQVGARDITQSIVGAAALLGHDPGSTVDVTLMLKCYLIGHQLKQWVVVDEWTTRDMTNQEHAFQVRAALRDKWALNWPEADEPQVLVRCDPFGDNDARTPHAVYSTWKHAGFNIKSAAYNKQGEGKGIVHKDAGIEMVNRLLRDAANRSRLFIACDDRGRPAAPKLVDALEMSERDLQGKAETSPKGSPQDLSHWCAALRYALWPYERLRDLVKVGRGKVVL